MYFRASFGSPKLRILHSAYMSKAKEAIANLHTSFTIRLLCAPARLRNGDNEQSSCSL